MPREQKMSQKKSEVFRQKQKTWQVCYRNRICVKWRTGRKQGSIGIRKLLTEKRWWKTNESTIDIIDILLVFTFFPKRAGWE